MAETAAKIEGAIPVFNPSGRLVTIPAEQWDEAAVFQGYKLATPQQIHEYELEQKYGEGAGNVAASAALGAGSALTFGVLPAALEATGAVSKEALTEIPKRSPIAHGIGEVVGVAAPLALSAGATGPVSAAAKLTAPSLIARGGRAAAEAAEGVPGLAGKLLPAAASAATESGLFAAQHVVEKTLLQDPEMTAQKGLGEIALAALLGGGLGVAGKALSLGAENLGDKLILRGTKAAQERAILLDDKEMKAAASSLGGSASDAFRKYRDARDILLDSTSTPENIASAQAFLQSEEGAALREAAQSATLERAPEIAAEYAGKKAAYAEMQAGREQRVKDLAEALVSPEAFSGQFGPRFERYAKPAAVGYGLGALGVGGSPGGALGVGTGLVLRPMYNALKRMAKDPSILVQAGRFLKNPAKTLGALTGITSLVEASDRAITEGLGGIFGATVAKGAAEAVTHAVDIRNFTKVASDLNQWSGNPEKLAEDLSHQTGEWQEHAPATFDAVHAVVSRGVDALAQAAPKRATSLPLDPPFEPSQAELAKFQRMYEVAQKPTIVLSKVADGTLTQDHMQAIQAIYPRLLQEMQTRAMERLAKEVGKGNRLSYRTRLSLGTFLGQPLDSSMSPAAIQATQMAWATAPVEPGPKPTPNKASAITLASRELTPSQATAKRRA